MVTHRAILRLAIPSIISNVTVPLLGLVDLSIVGHMGGADYIGAIALGSTLVSMTYWLLAFLRPGTGGLTAQAYGAGRIDETRLLLLRSLVLGLLMAMVLVAFQGVVADMGLKWMGAEGEVSRLARVYFDILIWGAPAMLGLYALQGWFLGMQNARYPMFVAVTQNIVNIAGSLAFVVLLGWQVEGVAAGTLLAQYLGFILALVLCCRQYGVTKWMRTVDWRNVMDWVAMRRFLIVNRDIFIRTLCLVAVTVSFTAWGTRLGSTILGANALLMQFFILFSYVMDGFAYAGEALGGRYYGGNRRVEFINLTRRLMIWGGGLAIAFTLLYIIGGEVLVAMLTNDAAVRGQASTMLPFIWFLPIAGMTAFIMDGLFIGATYTRGMLFSMAVAVGAYFLLLALTPLSSETMWLAFLVYLALRGVVQGCLFSRCLPPRSDQ